MIPRYIRTYLYLYMRVYKRLRVFVQACVCVLE